MTETKAQQECPYCHSYIDYLHHAHPYNQALAHYGVTVCYIQANYLHFYEIGYLDHPLKIAFCPMCGRKLGEDN
jgi:hypothetical protein